LPHIVDQPPEDIRACLLPALPCLRAGGRLGRLIHVSLLIASYGARRTALTYSMPPPRPWRARRMNSYVIGGPDWKTHENFARFERLCCDCYNIVRQNAHLFINLLSLMLPAGLYTEQDLTAVCDRHTHHTARTSTPPPCPRHAH
jgi:hypothetical protein